jgi:hypothetical protein
LGHPKYEAPLIAMQKWKQSLEQQHPHSSKNIMKRSIPEDALSSEKERNIKEDDYDLKR